MRRTLQLGLEVPAGGASLRPAQAETVEGLLGVVDAAMAAGFGAIWVRDGYGGADSAGKSDSASLDTAGVVNVARSIGTIDALTMAGGLAAHQATMVIGVIADVSAGRHPAVLARDVLTLDVVSEGRAAVLLVDPDLCGSSEGAGADRRPGAAGEPEPLDPGRMRPGSWDRLGEAANVCRAVFARIDPPPGGRYFPVGAARSHVRTFDSSGPVLAVQIDCPHQGRRPDGPGPGARGAAVPPTNVSPKNVPDQGLVACVTAADAIVTGGPAEALASIHALVASASQAAGRASIPPVVWRRPFTTGAHGTDGVGEPSMIGGVIARLVDGDHPSPPSLTALARTWGAAAHPEAPGPS